MSQQQAIKITSMVEKEGQLNFTISGTQVSFINGLRRAIMENVPAIVFKTDPYDENKCTIDRNTISGINNEYIKHRLSGIPIHITTIEETPIQNYIMELDVENKTDTIRLVTTADFKVKNTVTGKYLSDVDTRNIFPPNEVTGEHILFLKLKPQLAETIPGEAIKLQCEFSREISGRDGMYSQVCTCAYGGTVDSTVMEQQLAKEIQKWREEDSITREQVDLRIANWKLIDGKRICIANSFDFVVESIGVYTNRELVVLGCKYLMDKLSEVAEFASGGTFRIEPTKTTIPHSFDMFLEHDENYTVGCILEYLFYALYFDQAAPGATTAAAAASRAPVTFVGLKKFHPHDTYMVLRVGYQDSQEPSTVLQHLAECAKHGIEIVAKIQSHFVAGARSGDDGEKKK